MPDAPSSPAGLLAGGRLRAEPADFRVDECPLYELSGEGEHTYLHVEKTSLTTAAMVDRVARALAIAARDVGVAGMKDRHAITTQWISVPRVDAQAAMALDLPGIRVLEAKRHGNKLRTGHLAGNVFDILVRNVSVARLEQVQCELKSLEQLGLPNFHGPQRYGVRGDNAALGRALLMADAPQAVAILTHAIPERESQRVCEAREALAARDAARALELFPREFAMERHLAQCWRRGLDDQHAISTAPSAAATFLMNAWQSSMFDEVLAARLREAPRLVSGDVAMKLANGACFVVEDLSAEIPRAVALEIMPTGPLPGAKMLRPEGAARVIEDQVLSAHGCDPESLSSLNLPGARRALRVVVRDAEALADPCGIRFRFRLPAGSFATALLAHFGVHEASRP
jgi:tRNA pseudouridine13 synthase